MVEVSQDGRWIATMYPFMPPVIWKVETGEVHFRAEENGHIQFTPDNRRFALSSLHKVQIYELSSNEPIHPPIPVQAAGWTPPLEFSPDGLSFAVSLNRTHLRLCETATGRELATFSPPDLAPLGGNPGGSAAIRFTTDGHWLVAARSNGETIGWNLAAVRAELARLGLDWRTPSGAVEPHSPNPLAPAITYDALFSSLRRAPSTPARLIDLSSSYNARFSESWIDWIIPSSLAELPSGVQTLAGVEFDLRGLIQLGRGAGGDLPYPAEISGIPVKLSCQRLHFLHSAVLASKLEPDTEIGLYILRDVNGKSHRMPIRIGRELEDWFSKTNSSPGSLESAWSGESEYSRATDRTIRLFKSTWENPAAEVPIESLDFVSTHEIALPFLIAITAE